MNNIKQSEPMPEAAIVHPRLPSYGYASRMWLYCRRMYPLPVRLANAVLLYVALSLLVCRINGWPIELLSPWSLLATGNLFTLAFILRLMDELKDLDVDRQLFADRPVPSGAVRASDIRITLAGATGCYVIMNLLSPPTLWPAIVCLVYTYLMFAYFFAPDLMRRKLLLNLATHNPSVPLFLLLVTSVVSAQHHAALETLHWGETLLAILLFWSLVLAWELSRKIRCREEENVYVTYSQVFGRVPATLVTLAVQTVTIALAMRFAIKYHFALMGTLLLGVGYAVVLFAAIRFIARPSPRSSRLRPYGEAYTLFVFLAIIADHALRLAGE